MPYTAKIYSTDLLSESNIRKYVLPYYGLQNSEITQIKFKDTDKQRAVYKITDDEKNYCLKKVYFKEDELLFVYSAVEWFYRNHINVPRILPTNERGRFVDYKNMLFILTPWIYGRKCDYDNESDILLSISNLAEMHKCGKNFNPINGSSEKIYISSIYNSVYKHLQQLLICSNLAFKHGDSFSKLFLQHFETNVLLAKIAVEVASTINDANLSTSLCHLDYVNKNIIFDEHGSTWVIDFDKCGIDFCVHDISYCLRRLLKRRTTMWNLELTLNCLNKYEKIRSFTLDEYKYILTYLTFPQKFWKISRDYYNNINKCNQKSFITLIKRATEFNEEQLDFSYKLGKYIENKFNVAIT